LVIARVVLPLTLVGCAEQLEPLAPEALVVASAPALGTYELTVLNGTDLGGGQWQISAVPAMLHARVTFPDGSPVTQGNVVFQLLVGGRWQRIGTAPVNSVNGTTTFSPGVALPASFRFKYVAQGSGVKNGESNTIAVALVSGT
jgi:hypothetical protein